MNNIFPDLYYQIRSLHKEVVGVFIYSRCGASLGKTSCLLLDAMPDKNIFLWEKSG